MARRKALCTSKIPDKVLIKFTGIDLGLRPVQRTEQKERHLDRRRTIENKRHGLSTRHHRSTAEDSGFCAINGDGHVSFYRLLTQLTELGYVYDDGHSFVKPGTGITTNVLQFTLKGEAIPMPEEVTTALTHGVFNSLYAWCNPKVEGGKPDTINGVYVGCAQDYEDPAYAIVLTADNSYELLD
jgi:hypothetical protein